MNGKTHFLLVEKTFWQRIDFIYFCRPLMVAIAQLVRVSDCDSEGRGFEPHWLPNKKPSYFYDGFFYALTFKN